MSRIFIESIVSLTRFLLTSKSKILYVELPLDVFRKKLDVDAESQVSSYINIAQYTDLSQYDSLISEDETFWSKESSSFGKSLRYLLKLGWLTNDLRNNGLSNPIQLLQSKNGKYIAHPGTARAIVASYIYPIDTIKCFYIWDQDIDPAPPFLYYPHRIIKNPVAFYKLFGKRGGYFRIFTETLTQEPITDEYFRFVSDALKTTESKFKLDFLTVRDNYHWDEIRNRLFFKDVINFPDSTTCFLSGVKFVKVNNQWVRI